MTEQGRRTIDGVLLHGAIIRNVTRPLLIGTHLPPAWAAAAKRRAVARRPAALPASRGNVSTRTCWTTSPTRSSTAAAWAPSLLEAEIVPLSAREMLVTAERTGNLAEVSRLLGSYYEEEAENRMKQVVRLLEPLITVVMGAVVAVVVLSVMLPIFDLSSVGSH